MLEAQASVAGGAALEAWFPVPCLRGATPKVQDLVAGIAPGHFVTGGGGARELAEDTRVAMSPRRADIRDDVLGGRPAGEAAVEACRR